MHAFNVCSEKCINQKLDIIRSIANNNGFPLKFINKLIYQAQYGNFKSKFKYSEVKLHKFKYFSGLFECLRFKLKKYNVHLIPPPTPPPNLSKLNARLHNSIDTILMEDSASVCIIPSAIIRKLKEIRLYWYSNTKF